jgi:type I restriction enzyme M protein
MAPELEVFETTLSNLKKQLNKLNESIQGIATITPEQRQPLADALTELAEALTAYQPDRVALFDHLSAFLKTYSTTAPATNTDQHTARQAFDPLSERIKGLIKQVDLLYKLAARAGQVANDISLAPSGGEGRGEGVVFDRRAANKLIKQLDEQRKQAVEQMKQAVYFHRQIHWLQERFPDAVMAAVPGLCKVVSRADIEAADWSLTPGRYVGVAPAEVDEDFDFEQTIKDIHLELKDLNAEAVELAARIQENFEELGV